MVQWENLTSEKFQKWVLSKDHFGLSATFWITTILSATLFRQAHYQKNIPIWNPLYVNFPLLLIRLSPRTMFCSSILMTIPLFAGQFRVALESSLGITTSECAVTSKVLTQERQGRTDERTNEWTRMSAAEHRRWGDKREQKKTERNILRRTTDIRSPAGSPRWPRARNRR